MAFREAGSSTFEKEAWTNLVHFYDVYHMSSK